MTRALRIGVVNLMPQAERYEQLLGGALRVAARLQTGSEQALQLVWIRLACARYASSDQGHLAQHYVSYTAARRAAPLDALIVTGAPVETLPFEAVHYWRELSDLLAHAHATQLPTLGLCWGGLALTKLLGVDKVHYAKKLFGVLPLREQHSGQLVHCAQSRHAGVADGALERAAANGRIRLIAHGREAGHSVFASSDGLRLMHLGHPEYDVARLVFEYERDRAAGRSDVDAPVGIDLTDLARTPSSHGPVFFASWLASLGSEPWRQRARDAAAPAQSGRGQ